MTQRRSLGGARREATERVVLKGPGVDEEAWTLNVSRGGLRVVVEGALFLGSQYSVMFPDGTDRPVKVVWLREEADGQIAGLQFLDGPVIDVPGALD